MKNCKELVPELISIATSLTKINGFYFCQNISLCNDSDKKGLINVTVEIKDLKFPKNLDKKYSFRDGYYIYYKDTWYYQWGLEYSPSLKFIYREEGNNLYFYYNPLYNYIPFEIGRIFPVGRHIADLIAFKLFMNGYYCFTGCALSEAGLTTAWVSPSYNGKTTLIKNRMTKGARYITEDVVIVDKNLESIYPLNKFSFSPERRSKNLVGSLKDNANVLFERKRLDKLVFYINTFSNSATEFSPSSFLIANSLFFLRNRFIRAIILENNLGTRIFGEINKFISTLNASDKVYFKKIRDFNFY